MSSTTYRSCESCGTRMSPWQPRKRLPDGTLACKGCVGKHSSLTVAKAGSMDVQTFTESGTWVRPPGTTRTPVVIGAGGGGGGISRTAHDSGDGETIYHCPFCGAGSILGKSNGTAECQFCQTSFTVQVQPARSAVPQTIDGQPHIHPDMPGGDPVGGEFGAQQDPGSAPEQVDQTEETVTPTDEDQKMFAARTAMFVAADGLAMPEESYLKHLAVRYADEPTTVLAEMRSQR